MINNSNRLTRRGDAPSVINRKPKEFGVVTAMLLLLCATVLGCIFFMPKTATYAAEGDVAEVSYIGADDETKTDAYTSFASAWSAALSKSTATVKLLANVNAGSILTVETGKNITLDLNDKVLNLGGTSSVKRNIQINSGGTFTLTDSATTETEHTITAKTVVNKDATVNVTVSGGVITGGYVDINSKGSCFYVDGGTLNMSGGTIAGNTGGDGGGVYLMSGAFNMSGGTISYNGTNSRYGGGVYIAGGTFTMSDDAKITNNFGWQGGGVYLKSGTFNMSGGSISGNIGQYGVGGLYIESTTGNTFRMSGGAITDNEVWSGSSNSYICSGGIYSYNCTFELSGNPIINNNRDKAGKTANLYFANKNLKLKITGSLSETAHIGVSLISTTGVFTDGYDQFTHGNAEPDAYFFSDNSEYAIRYNDGELAVINEAVKYKVTVSNEIVEEVSCGSFGEALTAAASEERGEITITLMKNVTVASDETLSAIKKDVTLDLNDKVLNLNGTQASKKFISVGSGGTLTLVDNASEKTTHKITAVRKNLNKITSVEAQITGGVITGGYNNPDSNNGKAGCIYISNGTFNMIGGTIAGNAMYESQYGQLYSYRGYGGGVYVDGGTFNMTGGAISYNAVVSIASYGGGVYVGAGTFNMSGDAKISNNFTDDDGGGVYVNGDGEFIMTGGTISDNATGSLGDGGGVCVEDGEFTMSAGKITGNTAKSGGGVCLRHSISSSKYGKFEMSGTAEISGNIVDESDMSATDIKGGGVYLYDGTFSMKGGTISGNIAKRAGYGGGVYMFYDSAEFKFEAGKIIGNSAGYGGGIYVRGNAVISGAVEISNNKALEYYNSYRNQNYGGYGGGIYMDRSDGEFTMTGGIIKDNVAQKFGGGAYFSNGTFSISGSPQISGNYLCDSNGEKTDTLSNLYLTKDDDDTVTVKINVENVLTSTATIGISIAGDDTNPNKGMGVFTIGFGENGGAGTSVFVSDVDYFVMLEDGECTIIDEPPYTVTDASIVGSAIGTYTAGDTVVIFKIRRTLEKPNTDPKEITNDEIDYRAKVAPLHAGNNVQVTFTYTDGNYSKVFTETVTTVAKLNVSVSWYYNNNLNSARSAEKGYDGANSRSAVTAQYIDINGTTVTVNGASMNVMCNSVAATEVKNAGVYKFSLGAASPDDYVFLDNEFTFTVNKVGIDLSSDEVYHWELSSDSSALRSGYVYIYLRGGNVLYYYRELTETELERDPDIAHSRTVYVERSIVRFRNRELTLRLTGIKSYMSVRYTDNKHTDVGSYVSYANLGITDSVNYYYYVGIQPDQSRNMDIQIAPDGKSAVITKTWYIVNIPNALLSQYGSTYGAEYDISDWTYGDSVTVYAPRLEHGDEGAYNSQANFGSSDNKVMFELYRRDIGSTGEYIQLGEKFNRSVFTNYINKSMPSGEYKLLAVASAVSLTSSDHTHWYDGTRETGSLLYFEGFEQEFTFTVARASSGATVNDGIKDKTYTYDYDGELHFYKDDKLTVATSGAPVRTGVWSNPAYDGYYDGEIALKYYLAAWSDGVYRTAEEIAAMDGDKLRPVDVGSYDVYYIAALKNYDEYGGSSEYKFTVEIKPIQYKLDAIKFEDGSFVYDGEEHSLYITGAPSYIKVTYVGNGKTEVGAYTVTATLSVDGDNVTLVGDTELTATLTILTKTLEAVKGEGNDELWASADNDKGFEPNVELSVKELYGYSNAGIKENVEAAFEISLKKGGQEVEPAGKITISLLIPVELRGESFKILHIKRTSIEPVTYMIDGNYAVFTVDSLSPFVFVKSGQAATTTPPADDNNNMWWIWVIVGAVAVLIIILLLVLIFRRKKVQEVLPAPATEAAPTIHSETADMATKIAEAAAIVAEAAAIVAEAKRAKANSEAEGDSGVKVEPAPEKIAPAPEREKLEAAPAPKMAIAAAPEQPYDDDEITPEVDDDDTEVPSDDGFAGALEASSSETVTYSQSVLSKLLSSTDVVKNRYSELKNYLLAYKKARANMSRARESFYIGRNCYARIAVRGKTLCVYLALDPQKYVGTKYNVEDVLGVKSYADTPCLLRIKSEKALKLAMELIDELMPTIGAEKYDRKSENYVALFKSIEMLQKKKLISCSGNKKKN